MEAVEWILLSVVNTHKSGWFIRESDISTATDSSTCHHSQLIAAPDRAATAAGCFKPNECQKPAIFQENLVMDQLVQLLDVCDSYSVCPWLCSHRQRRLDFECIYDTTKGWSCSRGCHRCPTFRISQCGGSWFDSQLYPVPIWVALP